MGDLRETIAEALRGIGYGGTSSLDLVREGITDAVLAAIGDEYVARSLYDEAEHMLSIAGKQRDQYLVAAGQAEAERDAARAEAARYQAEAVKLRASVGAARAEHAESIRALLAARAEVEVLKATLREIVDADPFDMALDPGWPARVAKAALDG